MLILQNLSYIHPNKEVLFDSISFTINLYSKTALIGNNGAGKSTLLKIIAGELQPSGGQLRLLSKPYYVPQIFGQYDQFTIAQALGIDNKIKALHEILNGNVSEENYELLNDDWTIEERCQEALKYWQLDDLDVSQKIETLSGGQKTKVFLAGIFIEQPELIVLDEPSNHLDLSGRKLLYDFIQSTKSTLIVVSHDRKLLNLLDSVCELNKRGVTTYGGNFDFYEEQKNIATNALSQDIQSKEKALRKAKEKERETLERQQKLDSRGKGKQEKSGVSRIMMNTLRNNAENSTSKITAVHSEKIGGIRQELQDLRASLDNNSKIKLGFDDSQLHKGKMLFSANDINFSYETRPLWKENLTFQITSGERIVVQGANGSGKTTLIKLILGTIKPPVGNIYRPPFQFIYIDQDYSLIDNDLSVYDQAQKFNSTALQEHEIKMRLNRFLFSKELWEQPCCNLSGGEKMRLALCCLTIGMQSPDLIVLDEPTNNLDLQNITILTNAINEYNGTLIVVSHDETFLEQINMERKIKL